MCRGIFRTKEDTKVSDDVVDISGTELSSNSQFADDEYEYESENDQTEVMDSNLIYTRCIGPEFQDTGNLSENELYNPSSSESGEVSFSETGSATELSETEICDIIKDTEIYNCENSDALAF